MEMSWLVVACCLVGQTPPAPSGGEAPLVPVQARQPKPGAAKSLVRSLCAANEAALRGRPVTLLDILSPLVDRQQQIQVTLAYWELAAAVAEYNTSAQEYRRLDQLQPARTGAAGQAAPVPDPTLDTILASAQASLREAELSVVARQYRLAELALLPAGDELPLPADMPHVGPYLTRFEEFQARRTPPARARLIDRTLPLRRRSVDLRAVAVQAALDAADAAREAYEKGDAELSAVIPLVLEVGRQRRAFIAAARNYNHDIAEYALTVAPQTTRGAALVGMLIKPAPSPPGLPGRDPAVAEESGDVERAGFVEPADGRPGGEAPDEPTLAPPRNNDDEAPEPGVDEEDGTAPPADPFSRPGRQHSPSERRSEVEGGARHSAARKDPSGAGPASRVSGGEAEGQVGLYPALVDLAPAKRTQELAAVLYWDRVLAETVGTPVALGECLAWGGGWQRRTVIGRYWQAREQAARYQVLGQRVEQLEALSVLVLGFRNRPGGPAAMLRWRLAKMAADADLIDAEVELLAGRFGLREAAGRPQESEWPLPTTAPHAGSYRLKLEAQAPAIAAMPAVRRLAQAIPALHAALVDRSRAVMAADQARVAAAAGYDEGRSDVDEPLAAIQRQSDETLAFLGAVTQYNLQIADYALWVLPPETPDQTLVGALVVARPASSQGGL